MATSGRRNDPAFKRRVVQKVVKKTQASEASHVVSEAFDPEKAHHHDHHKHHLKRWEKPQGFKRSKALDMVFVLLLSAGIAAYAAGQLGGGSGAAQENTPTETEQSAEEGEGEATAAADSEKPVSNPATPDAAPPKNTISEAVSVKTADAVETTEVKAEIRRRKGDFIIPCWIVAYSANADKQQANVNFSTLEALGYDAGQYFIPKYFKDGRQLYKVYVGPFKSLAEAEGVLPKIQKMQPDAYVLKIDE
jgi:cell division septation protein DedD